MQQQTEKHKTPTGSYHLTILGRPVVQKNGKEIALIHEKGKAGKCRACGQMKGRRTLGDSKAVKAWKRHALPQLAAQWGRRPAITDPVDVFMIFFRGKGQRSDTDNLEAAPLDALERCRNLKKPKGCRDSKVWKRPGVLLNDNQVSFPAPIIRRDWDNPRIELLICPEGTIFPGLRGITVEAASPFAPWAEFVIGSSEL